MNLNKQFSTEVIRVSLRMLDLICSKGSQCDFGYWLWPCNRSLFPSLFSLCLFLLKLYFHFWSCLCSPWWIWQVVLPLCIFKINLTILFIQSSCIFYSPNLLFSLPFLLSYSRFSWDIFFFSFCQLKMSKNTDKTQWLKH